MTPDAASAPQHQLAPYVKAIRRRAGLIALVTLAALGVSLALSLSATKVYTATARLFLHQGNPVSSIVNNGGDQSPADPQRDLNSRVSLITSQTVAQAVIDKLRLQTTTKKLLEDEVSADVAGDTDIAQVAVKDEDPNQAAKIADEFAAQYVANRQEAARATILEAAKLAQSQLDQLTPEERNGAQGRELARRARELQINAALQTGNVEIVDRAQVPADPSSPRTALSAIVAVILGLLVGLALAVGLEFLDRRLRDVDDVEVYNRPILASVPTHSGGIAEAFESDFAVREAFLTFATSLRFFNLGREVNVLAITSPGPGEGKTSATLGLSAALTSIGLRVITIESDLRRPMFSEYVGLNTGAGLSTVLAGVSTFEHQLIDIDARTLHPIGGSGTGDVPYFSILPAGPIPPNPQGLLSSPEMANVIARARAMADVVLLDTAPIGTVNDVVTLAELTNGIALLVRLGATRRDALVHALRILDNVSAPVLGFVVNGARRGGAKYYGYDKPRASAEVPV